MTHVSRLTRPARAGGALVALLTLISAFLVSTPQARAADELPGLKGDYYRSSGPGIGDFREYRSTQVDPNLDFNSLEGVLLAATGRNDEATVRWTGRIRPSFSETYTFSMIGDNGFRLWVDDKLILDHWVDDWDVRQTSQPITLQAGQLYDVKVEYFENYGGSNLHLSWSSPSQPMQIVPASAFFLPAGYTPPYTGDAAVSADGTRVTLDSVASFVAPIPANLASSLVVEVDGIAFPITGVALDPADASKLVITLNAKVQRGSLVRVRYNGTGGLATTEKTLPEFSVPAVNSSTYTLDTPWAAEVSPTNALPEYPRPQLTRTQWQNLNGTWEFAAATAATIGTPPTEQTLGERVLVPYPIESKLSGIQRHVDRFFYRRTFTVPAGWNVGSGQRLKLHFGAVDYQATVWVNGKQVATHTGGFDAFSADITDAVNGTGPQEIIVGVVDTTAADQVLGKQRANPSGIFYTPASGIWQTVWIEPVAAAHIDELDITADLAGSAFKVNANSASASAGATVEVVVSAGGTEVARATGAANAAVTVPVADPHLWTPDDPFLYDLKVTLKDGTSTDTVGSYQGMRSIGLKVINGKQRIVLNGKPTFLLSTLDQGYWPDGILTAPTDEALAFDLVQHKEMGFNTVRKHIKTEPDRWYYWADRLGLMVWQDMPSTGSGSAGTPPAFRQAYLDQLREVVDEHDSITSVIG
ncbi:PA14 domain-containing protein, partial [Motilibacter deserti]